MSGERHALFTRRKSLPATKPASRGAPATRWRSSVRVSAWSRGERSRPACGHCGRQPFTTGSGILDGVTS